MNCDATDPVDGVNRRSVLAAGAAGLSLSLSGCTDTVRSVVDEDWDDRLSLSLLTVPADGNRENLRIARHLESNLEAVGIDVTLTMRSPSELLERVLIDHDFDVYVGRHPAEYDPDFLYEALHSTYANESGWQNPYGFNNVAFDTLLENQRRAVGDERDEHVASILHSLAAEKPFDPICRPDEYRVARTDRFDGWETGHLATRRGYLGLEPVGDADDVERLDALVTDARPSQNVNPLSATIRDRGTVVDLLYDSLGTVVDGEVQPWLAAGWEWSHNVEEPDDADTAVDDDSDDAPATPADGPSTATITLREECTFHDGEPVTADDVAFTYRLLEDTTLGRTSFPSPAPRYRGHVSAVEDVVVEDDHRLQVTFDANQAVGERALTVPILPRHVWLEELEDRLGDIDDDVDSQGQWGLVTTSSVEPIGSGPYRFESQSERSYLSLERFDDHFTRRDGVDLLAPHAEELRFNVDPGSQSSIARVENGAADVTASMLEAHSIGDVPDDDPDVYADTADSWTFYHVGFNTRTPPCSNLHFRRAVCQLIDKGWVVDEIFYGRAEPLATPVTDDWVPDPGTSDVDLTWDGDDPVTPFAGTDGTLNVPAARSAFEAAGYPVEDDRGSVDQH